MALNNHMYLEAPTGSDSFIIKYNEYLLILINNIYWVYRKINLKTLLTSEEDCRLQEDLPNNLNTVLLFPSHKTCN